MFGIFLYFARQINLNEHVTEFIALALAAGALYLAAVFVADRLRLGRPALLLILVAAAAFRLILLPSPPSLSTDIYRYQWEGRIEAAKINPYRAYPAEKSLVKFQNPAHPIETGANVPSAYPPLTEFAFSWVHTLPSYKRLFTALDFATVGVILWMLFLLKDPPHRVLIYAWNPTVIVSFSLSGHHDSLAILTLMLALLAIIARKPLMSNLLLALSFVSKFFSIIFLPLFLKRTRWSYLALFAGVVAAAYLPYMGAGRGLLTGFRDYAAGWEGNDSLFRIINLASASKTQAEFVAAVLLAGLMFYVTRSQIPLLRAGLVLTAGLLLLSPNAFPWYFTWSVPFLCFTPSRPWLLMSVTAVLGYAPVVAYTAGQPYRNSALILLLEYGPVVIWLVVNGTRELAGVYAAETPHK